MTDRDDRLQNEVQEGRAELEPYPDWLPPMSLPVVEVYTLEREWEPIEWP